ncbi:glycosyltransferase family 1 protein [Bacillus sp. EB01]|uniref:glycosyltransferase family 1 protein n=1 Tax=Bacillus sp. EB01 TaxID=1347086 RepID=UPI0006934E3A|nr:glycosyltransferase family 1 protein [Bacillus sp. EB01]
MKILIISTTRFDMDGITNVILNYFRAMDKSDIQFDFVVPNTIRSELEEEILSYNSQIYKIEGRMRNPIRYINKLIKIIKNNKYDIIHAHGNSCTLAIEMYAAKKSGVLIRIPHSHNSKTKYKIFHVLLRNSFDSYYTHGFACGTKAGRWLYKEKPFEVINNGIDISKYIFNKNTREEYRQKLNLKDDNILIGHVGHFNYQKNHDYLIEVFKELYKLNPKFRLMLIGEGALKNDIEQKTKEMGLSEFIYFVGKSFEVPNLMQAMDMIVMTSRFEGLPLTLIEAQAACLPCFVADTVSNEVEITDLVRFISLNQKPNEWASIIVNNNPKDRSLILEQVKNKIISSGFSIKENAQKMKELYNNYYSNVIKS